MAQVALAVARKRMAFDQVLQHQESEVPVWLVVMAMKELEE